MGFPDPQIIKNLPALRETQVLSLGWKIPWRKEWLSSPVFLSGEIPWIEEPCGLLSMRSESARHDWVAITFTFNTSQLFYFLISKIVCMFLRICQYLLYSVIYRHYWSQYFLIFLTSVVITPVSYLFLVIWIFFLLSLVQVGVFLYSFFKASTLGLLIFLFFYFLLYLWFNLSYLHVSFC